MGGRMGGRAGPRRGMVEAATSTLAAMLVAGCTAAPQPEATTAGTAIPSRPGPSATDAGAVAPLDDGTYRAASYLATGASVEPGRDASSPPADVLASGTLVDLGDGCLGLESTDDGERRLVAFPAETALEDGVVSAVGMDPFGLSQPLRYEGSAGAIDRPRSTLAVPDGCADAADEVWYFVAPKRAGIGGPGDE